LLRVKAADANAWSLSHNGEIVHLGRRRNMTPGDFPSNRTRRQELAELLTGREWSFEELRGALSMSVRLLEDDLHHLDRSLRRGDRRLVVTPSRCGDCGYEFRGRAPKHFHKPGRCPRCRSEHILDTRLEIAGR
jgi:predicted Zn-ribbon and HTH transcriptional regulator